MLSRIGEQAWMLSQPPRKHVVPPGTACFRGGWGRMLSSASIRESMAPETASFVLRHSGFFRHSCLVIRASRQGSRMEPLGIALIGCGTVGGGVARLLLEQPERLAARAARPLVLRC